MRSIRHSVSLGLLALAPLLAQEIEAAAGPWRARQRDRRRDARRATCCNWPPASSPTPSPMKRA